MLFSPATLGYMPVLLLQAIGLGYLFSLKQKTRPTWLFIALHGCMTIFTLTRGIASTLYSISSFYLDWWGGTGSAALAFSVWLQFAYIFPRPRYPREARLALILSTGFTLSLFAWMAWITFSNPPHLLDPLTSAGLPPNGNLATFSAVEFLYRFVEVKDSGWTSHNVFNYWVILVNIWVLILWVRKTVDASRPENTRANWHSMLQAFLAPGTEEASISRGWAVLTFMALLPTAASFLEPAAALPQGSFTVLFLMILFALHVTYLNNAPEETTILARMLGVSLLTILLIMGLVGSMAIQKRDEIFHQIRLAELAFLRSAIKYGHPESVYNGQILYVAAREPEGLFADHYELLFSRSHYFTAATLAAWDDRLRQGLESGDLRFQAAAAREFPWLGFGGVADLMGNPARLRSISLPENTIMYRGVSFPPEARAIRYSFLLAGKRYEVGYDYTAYRQSLHTAVTPWVIAMAIISLFLMIIYGLYFQFGLLNHLQHLLENITRVDQGDLSVRVQKISQDEIGQLAQAFNRMVESLSVSQGHLESLGRALEKQVDERTRDLSTLYELTALVNQNRVTDDLLQVALERIVTSIQAEAGLIWLLGLPDEQTHLSALYKIPAQRAVQMPNSPLWQSLRARKEPLLIHNIAGSLTANEIQISGRGLLESWPYATLVSIPILIDQEHLGLLILFGVTPHFFSVDDVELLKAAARQLSLAIKNIHLREQVALSAAQEERQRLARDLHDSVTQLLYSQVLFSEAAAKSIRSGQDEKTQHYLLRLGDSARNALREMRLLLYRLLPYDLSQLGLAGSLQRRLELVEQRAGMQTHFSCNLLWPLLPNFEQTLYSIAEEALNNVIKHAAANSVWVDIIQRDEAVELRVTDDGSGFDPNSVSAGLGLRNMRERTALLGGSFTIETPSVGGTLLTVRLPKPFQTPVKPGSEENIHGD